jgi:hypothetical protein
MPQIFKLKDIEVDDITFTDFNDGEINISYLGKYPLLIEIPPLCCNGDIILNKTKYTTHELYLNLLGKNDYDTNAIDNFFKKLDSKLIGFGKLNYKNWGLENKNIMYKSVIREFDKESPQKNGIKVKFMKSKNFNTLLFDQKQNIIHTNDYQKYIKKGCYVKMIIELVCIWIKNSTYGIHIKLHQMKLCQNSNGSEMLSGYSFCESSDDDSYDGQSTNQQIDNLQYILSEDSSESL